MEIELTPIEVRVLGCMIEKEIATPDYYPLTLNALVTACNQKSNRDPVMALTDTVVVEAIDAMRYDHKLAIQMTSTASRVPKYQHNLPSHWDLPLPERAVLCELFLRGPQTVGELRTHGSRLHQFANTSEVEATLAGLTEWGGGPLVVQLPREPGRREPRWAHLFCGEIDIETLATEPQPEPARVVVQAKSDRITALEEDVAALRQSLEALTQELSTFRKQFE